MTMLNPAPCALPRRYARSASLGVIAPKRISCPPFAAAIMSSNVFQPFDVRATTPIWNPAVVVSGVKSAWVYPAFLAASMLYPRLSVTRMPIEVPSAGSSFSALASTAPPLPVTCSGMIFQPWRASSSSEIMRAGVSGPAAGP